MYEFIEKLFIAIGGGTVVFIGMITILKSLTTKLFETYIESFFEKGTEKFKNNLNRSTKAYEMLLDREMQFYEKIDPIIAELIPLEQDLVYYLKYNDDSEIETQYENYREHFKKYCKLMINLKNEILVHQLYIPSDIINAYSDIIGQMQNDMAFWYDMLKFFYTKEYAKIDYSKCESIINSLLLKISIAEVLVRKRLEHLVENNN